MFDVCQLPEEYRDLPDAVRELSDDKVASNAATVEFPHAFYDAPRTADVHARTERQTRPRGPSLDRRA
jgi:hypothetical protein